MLKSKKKNIFHWKNKTKYNYILKQCKFKITEDVLKSKLGSWIDVQVYEPVVPNQHSDYYSRTEESMGNSFIDEMEMNPYNISKFLDLPEAFSHALFIECSKDTKNIDYELLERALGDYKFAIYSPRILKCIKLIKINFSTKREKKNWVYGSFLNLEKEFPNNDFNEEELRAIIIKKIAIFRAISIDLDIMQNYNKEFLFNVFKGFNKFVEPHSVKRREISFHSKDTKLVEYMESAIL